MKRILMLSNHPLFRKGVETLLHQKIDIEFVGRESDVDKAIDCIKLLQPDIVIVDHEFASCTQSPVLLKILGEGFNTKIIGMNLQTNTICIYRGEKRSAQNVQDLIYAIENDLSKSELFGVAETFTQGRSETQESERRIEKSNEIIN